MRGSFIIGVFDGVFEVGNYNYERKKYTNAKKCCGRASVGENVVGWNRPIIISDFQLPNLCLITFGFYVQEDYVGNYHSNTIMFFLKK